MYEPLIRAVETACAEVSAALLAPVAPTGATPGTGVDIEAIDALLATITALSDTAALPAGAADRLRTAGAQLLAAGAARQVGTNDHTRALAAAAGARMVVASSMLN